MKIKYCTVHTPFITKASGLTFEESVLCYCYDHGYVHIHHDNIQEFLDELKPVVLKTEKEKMTYDYSMDDGYYECEECGHNNYPKDNPEYGDITVCNNCGFEVADFYNHCNPEGLHIIGQKYCFHGRYFSSINSFKQEIKTADIYSKLFLEEKL